jgi:hypothetical protein
MPYDAPIEAGLVMLLARSVGDDSPVYVKQLRSAPGQALVTSPTFVRALEHFNPTSITRPNLPREVPEFGGSTDTVHVEQHFEYIAPFRQGEFVTVKTSQGEPWSKSGRSGRLDFTETTTEYCSADGDVLVRARKVSVRIVAAEAP